MEGNMFCYQCQEAAKGTGCVLRGVCGKKDTTARYMDLLLFVVRGVSVATDTLRTKGYEVEAGTNEFVTDALFSTITNANFDDESILARVRKGLELRDRLKVRAVEAGIVLPEADELTWNGKEEEYLSKSASVGVLREPNEDLRSLKELLMYAEGNGSLPRTCHASGICRRGHSCLYAIGFGAYHHTDNGSG